ncbi:cilia- and flagella-associated protein 77 [Aquarana catesbeiana]|uniref:cilia- and flagella-associated protein 77 n=1 Tax=Aquarana catesbeiana TaxID=8400 RepID=UPI003CCA1B87
MMADGIVYEVYGRRLLPGGRILGRRSHHTRTYCTDRRTEGGSMDNERFGVVRESMNNNQLLQKAELGKTKKMCYSLPGSDFTYGQSSFLKEGGVATAIGHWQTVEAKARQRKLESNFVALNREAVKSGLVTSTEHQTFRNTHKIWLPVNEGRVKDHNLRIPPGMTFGISTRPSTPICELIEHKYQNLWLEQQRQASEALRVLSKEKIKMSKVQDTRTTMLRRYQPEPDPAPLWQLPRFQKVEPHLDTFPSVKARQRAFSAHHSDAIARRGLHGQGIYNIS